MAAAPDVAAISEPSAAAPRLPEAADPMGRIFRYLRPYRARLTGAISSSVANKILDMMPPLLVGWVIDSLRGQAPGWISALAGTADPWRLAVVLTALSVVIFVFESLYQWL